MRIYRLIGLAYIVGGTSFIIYSLALSVGATLIEFDLPSLPAQGLFALIQVFHVVILLIFCIPAIMGGYLIFFNNRHRRRIMKYLSFIFLVLFPAGTVLAIVSMIYLTWEGECAALGE